MSNPLARFAVPALAAIALAAGGIAFAQSGTAPSGTPRPSQQSEAHNQAAAAETPKVIALWFYADWCPGCKALEPKLTEVMKDSASQPCLFVKLDMSDKQSHQAEYLLAALGQGELWKEYAGQTGFVLLVDGKTHEPLGTLMANQDTREIKATLASALKS